MALQVTRADALELFEALGSTTADKWNTKRLAAKLSTIDKMVDEDTQLEGNADKTLTTVLKAIEAEDDIMIVEPARKAELEPEPESVIDEEKPKPKKGKKPAAPVEEPEPESESEGEEFAELKAQFDAGEITAKQFAAQRRALLKDKKQNAQPEPEEEKPKPKKKAKAADKKPAKPAKPKAEKPDKEDSGLHGVRTKVTRPYLAGVIIQEHGRDVGITKEMADELDKRYGKKNPAESMFCLRNAWHAIRGFVESTE